MKALNCASCAAGKAKQKSLKKVNFVEPDNEKDGYRAYLDLSTVKKNENSPMPTNLNWQLLVVGMKLQIKISHFCKSKNAMVEPTCKLMHHWWQAGKIISKLRMNNAGKNKKLASRLESADWKDPVVIEYTTRDTPQQNSPVEVAFYALAYKAHITMHHANLPMEIWYQLFGEIFTRVIEISGKHASWYEHFFREVPRFVCSLCTVGEVGTVKIKMDTTPKLEDWEYTVCLWDTP